MNKKIAFLIPALNEEEGIATTIHRITEKFAAEKSKPKVYVIDGGSNDKTVEVSKKAGAEVILSPRRGYGFQYKYSLDKIDADIVVTGDADGTYPMENAMALIKMLEKENLDFITTNRFANLEKDSMSFSHYLGNMILTKTGNLLFGIELRDNQSGMWCFRLDKIRELCLENNDMAFSEEIKIRALKSGLRCKEVGISYKPRIGQSKLNYSHAYKNFFFLFLLKFKL